MTEGESNAQRQARSRSPKVDLPTKRRRKHGGRKDRPRRDNRKSRFAPGYTAEDEKHNAQFEAYYRQQNIVPPHEFPKLLKTLATALPTSFRVSADGAFKNKIQETLHGEMTALCHAAAEKATQDGNSPMKPLAQLPWYPDGLAWTISAPRQMLRRDNELAPFHKFLVKMNDIGAINRQEAVSMVPPLLLDVQPGQSVLDMCAAPGSKTAQILDSLSREGCNLSSQGVVIANDADMKRCWMLVHQLKRFGSAELVVTQHEAQDFPKFMMFDRVLCDVPCSGDGTLRKAPDIWRRWNSHMGMALHRLQRQIVERGVDILKPGGLIVYSTCSMNPLENEAIVAHVLRKFGDDVELLDCSDKLPQLIRRPGLKTWLVKDNSEKVQADETAEDGKTTEEVASNNEPTSEEAKNSNDVNETPAGSNGVDEAPADDNDASEVGKAGQTNEDASASTKIHGWFRNFEEVPDRGGRRKRIVASMFPPSEEEFKSGQFPLERCMRLVPHDQDTGAFFVAVFKKNEKATVCKALQREVGVVFNKEGKLDDGHQNGGVVKKGEKLDGDDQDQEVVTEDRVDGGSTKDGDMGSNSKESVGGPTMKEEMKSENLGAPDDAKQEEQNDVEMCNMAKTEDGERQDEAVRQEDEGLKEEEVEEKDIKATSATRLISDDPLVDVSSLASDTFSEIVDYFGLEAVDARHLMTRGADGRTFKRIVVVSDMARRVLWHGVGTQDGQVGVDRKVVRVVNAGVRVLERTDRKDTKCRFRLISDGARIMRGCMAQRVIDEGVVKEDVVHLLKKTSVKFSQEELAADGLQFWKRLFAMGSGSAIIVCDGEDIIVWVGKRAVNVVMGREVIAALLLRFGVK